MSLLFEWDGRKAAANVRKHRVSFEEAASVFGDALARIFNDEDHSNEEDREIVIGHSAEGRLLVVSFVARRSSIRILSARRATKRERRDYEENVLR